jgi:pSer/pThr/pTyr-binding forkhead associated (FHA) protein
VPQNFGADAADPDRESDARREKTGGSGGKPAFLFNKLTNDRHALTQSVSKIGRDQTNNISITNDHYISRHHAWVLQMQGGYWVEDLGSTNGTLLNGEVLNERKQIFPGDRLTFGKTELVFIVD